MTTAQTIIEKSLRKIHVLGRGQSLQAEEAQSALETLNDMIGTFSAESGMIYNNEIETFPLTGKQFYTIGAGGDFDTVRPIDITSVYVSLGNIDYPAEIISSDEYSDIDFKAIAAGPPRKVYFKNNVPLASLYVYPVGATGYTITLYSLKPLTSFSDLTTDHSLPEGVENMLVWNLAVQLAPEYEQEPTPFMQSQARTTKGAVKGYVQRTDYPESKIDNLGSHGGSWNILGGRVK